MEDPGQLLAFVHIPKAAGTTFDTILRHHYPGRKFNRGGNVFERIEVVGSRLEASARGNPAAVSAEITFGLAEIYFPGARYLTILREPVQRALSHFRYFKSGRGHGLVPPWLSPPPADLTLEQALAEGSYIPDNLQTRMLCGLQSPFDPLPSDALEQAERNLAERFFHVGMTDRFDEFVAGLNVKLDWPTLAYLSIRVNKHKLKDRSVSVAEQRLLEEKHALDTELYAFANRLVDQAVARAGAELQTELEVIREAIRRPAPSGPRAARELPVEARVELALKERQLARAERMVANSMHGWRADKRAFRKRLADGSLKAKLRRLLGR